MSMENKKMSHIMDVSFTVKGSSMSAEDALEGEYDLILDALQERVNYLRKNREPDAFGIDESYDDTPIRYDTPIHYDYDDLGDRVRLIDEGTLSSRFLDGSEALKFLAEVNDIDTQWLEGGNPDPEKYPSISEAYDELIDQYFND